MPVTLDILGGLAAVCNESCGVDEGPMQSRAGTGVCTNGAMWIDQAVYGTISVEKSAKG